MLFLQVRGRRWIQRYIEWFNDQPVGNLTPAVIQEYTSLAHIQADRPVNRQLLEGYFYSLCDRIQEVRYRKNPLIQALEYTLQTIDNDLFKHGFEEDRDLLTQLADDLLAKLDPGKAVLSKETYPTYRSRLYALHQTLLLIQQIDPNWYPTQKKGPYSQFKEKIDDLKRNAQYYPIRYHARLLEQSLQRLLSEKSKERLRRMRIVNTFQGALSFAQGLLSLASVRPDLEAFQKAYESLEAAFARKGIDNKTWYDSYQAVDQGKRALTALYFDIKAFVSGYDNLKAAFVRQRIEDKPWYDWHQALNYASLLSLGDAREYEVFEQGLQAIKAKEATIRKEKDRQALRFGIVMQLRMLALHSSNDAVRKQSIDGLSSLAESEAWAGDRAVMEGLLDGLAGIAVHSQGQDKEQAQEALESLTDSPEAPTRSRILFWRRREKPAQSPITAWLGGKDASRETQEHARSSSSARFSRIVS